MAKTLEFNLQLIDSVTDASRQMATNLGDVNKAITNVSQSFKESDNSLQGFVNKVSSINQLSKAFSGVYAVVKAQNAALKNDALEWVFEKTEQVANGVTSMKNAYDGIMEVYTQLQPLYQMSLRFLTTTQNVVGGLAERISLQNIAMKINQVRTYLCTVAQAAATIVTKLWNKATDHAINNALVRLPLALTATTIGMTLYMAVAIPATIATYAFSAALKSVTKAIYSIPVVGWILAIIGAIIAFATMVVKAFKWLWENSMEFREVLFGVWEVIKTVFGGLWDFIASIGTAIVDFFVSIWEGLTGFITSAWEGIVGFFAGLWENATNFFTGIWESIVGFLGSTWTTISGIFINIWDKLVGTFTAIKDWITSNLVQPIKNAFSGLWEFICGIVNKVINKLDGMLAPIRALWNKLFGNISGVWETGKAKGREDFLKDKEKKEKKTGEADKKTSPDTGLLLGGGITPAIPNMGNGGSAVNDKIGAIGGDSGKVSNTYITLGSLVETLTIQASGVSEGINDMRDMVVKTLLEVLNGQNVAGAKY